ncbi:YceI family protein [Sediminibacterium soli]|uniref:YceI family protein n=1 Tax=Sediminibacterium soli TaxID=2698829 RepID=UPI00137969A6|nr:YceI family protein [Sediminibacterium soli]NCI47739.1 YceI family protein [Sediminibacterium soli]
MKSVVVWVLSIVFFVTQADAQKVFGTRNGKISFSAPDDEDVKAVNNEVTSRISDNGQMTFSLLMKSFLFKMAEMQEHFNDQYAETSKYPRADFKGNIQNLSSVNFAKDGAYKISVKGDLTMHGITKNVTVNGTVNIRGGKPLAAAQFSIVLKDFGINASSVTDKVTVDVSCQYQ